MANCRACGAPLNPQERFCGYCGTDQYGATQTSYGGQASAPSGGQGDGMARAAMGLGIAGGLLGILWGALGPYLTFKWPNRFLWGSYGTGIRIEILLIVGLVLGVLGIMAGMVAPRTRGVAAVLLIISGLAGFILGGSWLIPGALLLVAGGLAAAANRA